MFSWVIWRQIKLDARKLRKNECMKAYSKNAIVERIISFKCHFAILIFFFEDNESQSKPTNVQSSWMESFPIRWRWSPTGTNNQGNIESFEMSFHLDVDAFAFAATTSDRHCFRLDLTTLRLIGTEFATLFTLSYVALSPCSECNWWCFNICK